MNIRIVIATASALAQTKPGGSPEQIKAELINIEREIGRANLQCDYRYFDRVEADEFFSRCGRRDKRQEGRHGRGERLPEPSDFTYDVDDSRVALYGGAAVVNNP